MRRFIISRRLSSCKNEDNMSTNFFDQEEGEFRDQPDEVKGHNAEPVYMPGPAAPRRAPATPPAQKADEYAYEPEQVIDDLLEASDDEDDYSSVLSDARLRLEQGRLYEMIMNHDLFEGMDSDPAAVKHVQRQIRKFAKEQMEIMLGMRKETAKVETLQIDFPFNQLEVDILKKLAFTATKGQSERSDKFVPQITRTTEEVQVVPKKTTLNSIVSKKPVVQAKPQIVQQKAPVAKAPTRPLQTTAAVPVKRKALTQSAQQILAEEGISADEMDQTFEPEYKPLSKPLDQMTSDEILARNSDIDRRRHKTVKSTTSQPMPSYEQEQMLHQQRSMENSTGANSAVSLILGIMNKNK